MIARFGEVCQGKEHDPTKPRAGKVELDHIKPLATNPALAFDPSNVILLCKSCHQKKTVQDRIDRRNAEHWLLQAYRAGSIGFDEYAAKLKALNGDG